ncbi:hypothetical protein [Proteus sp. fly-1067]|uniref:hypothetical protein n=1 Tax=Proteus sp. fly-1067 TaxID=3136674 RepID=UPI0032DB4F86
MATTVDTLRGTNIAKEESRLDNLSDTAYDNLYQALSEIKDNVTERDIQNYLFQQRLQDYTNQSDFGTGGNTYGYHRDNAAIGDAPLQVLQGGVASKVMAPLLGGQAEWQHISWGME